MSHPLRTLVGCTTLSAVLWILATTEAADTPQLPTESYKKAAAADLKFLQSRLGDLVAKEASGAKVAEGQVKPAVGVALVLSVYGDALGDAGLKADAVKVAELLVKKDFKGAEAAGKKLAVKPGAAGKLGALPKPFKDGQMLDIVMNPFRGVPGGGLGIDKDIKDMIKTTAPMKIEPAAVEILAVRSAVLNSYGYHVPNDKAKVNDTNKKLWQKWSTESVDLSKQIATEAGKGASADIKKLKDMLGKLNARCTDCHNKFRDDD